MIYAIFNITNQDQTNFREYEAFQEACESLERDGYEFNTRILYWVDGPGYVTAERAKQFGF